MSDLADMAKLHIMPKYLCFLILVNFTFIPFLTSQNLLLNGSFEKHNKLDCTSCVMLPEKFASVLSPWRTINGTSPFICDCQDKRDGRAIEVDICPFDKVKPADGNTMLEMSYEPSCYDWDFKTRGCSSYLGTRLSEPLEIGKVYEISFWLHILPSKDSSYTKYIGCNLYTDAIRNPRSGLLDGSDFLLDTVIYNQWYQAKWVVRPICNLQFLVLGVFRGQDGPPVNSNGNHSRFYVDNVAIVPVASTTNIGKQIIPYCKYKEKEKEDSPLEIAGTNCFFNTNDSTLSAAAITELDSFASRAKKNPSVAFIISGHTDDVGSNHLALSRARVNSVINYLENNQQIPTFRFIQLYRGDADPAAINTTENGRQKNRRVEIRQTDSEMADVLYRNLLLEVFDGHKEQAFKLLNIWLNISDNSRKIYVLFDPRLAALQSDKRWNTLVVKKLQEAYKTYKKPRLAFALDSLGKEDQKCRTLSKYVENLQTYFTAVDSLEKRFDVNYFPDTADYLCNLRDEAHLKSLKKLIGSNDWPKISEVGERAAKSAFLIIAHSSDSTDLAHYLTLLKQRCTEGEAEWVHYAMLYDRLQVWRGLPQRFGTQSKPAQNPDDQMELFPLEDASKVNQWREELGMELLNGY